MADTGSPPPAVARSKYCAFISYSHSDHVTARWLHRAIETYRLPRLLVGRETPFGPVPVRLPPVFRDRDELPASGDLGQELRAALTAARFQIVLCSPRAAASKWVNEEILAFKRTHGEMRVLAVILSGEPYAGDAEECFPPALRFRLAADGTLSDVPAEPIAADLRHGKDGKRLALLKLIAGITGLPLDALVRRDVGRRYRRLMWIAAGSVAVSLMTIGLAIYANLQRQVAEHQRQLADKSVEFLTGTFAVANPATENPRTITVLSVLDRASKRAAQELRNEPEVAARLLQTTGEIYFNLGLTQESERDLRTALVLTPAKGETRARIFLNLASGAVGRSDAKAATGFVDAAEAAIEPRADYKAPLHAEATYWRGTIQYLKGNYAKSVAVLNTAQSLYHALPGDNRKEIGQILMSKGRGLSNLRDYFAADTAFAQAEAVYTAKFGTNHMLTARAMQNRALGMLGNEKLDVAQAKVTQALVIYDRILERNHPAVASSNLLLGRIRTARRDYKNALAAFDEARAIYAKIYGADNSLVGDVDFYAAEAQTGLRRIDAALGLLAETKRIYDKAYGPDDPDQVELLMARMKVYAAAKRNSDAAAQCKSALALARKLDPHDATLPTMQAQCSRF